MKHSSLNKNFSFTDRELDVMAFIFCTDGHYTPTKKICQHLLLTRRRVDSIIHDILVKIQGSSRYDIVCFIEVNSLKPSLEARYHQLPHTEHVSSFHFLGTVLLNFKAVKKYASLKMLIASIIVCLCFLIFTAYKWEFLPQHQAITIKQHLQRPHLIDTINQALQPGTTVALIGPGGAGKTTLAHLYANQCRVAFVKHINAETDSSLLTSFKSLAERLVSHDDQRQILQSILNQENPIHDLVEFVYKALRQQDSWLLVFDNVNDIALCRRFLPSAYQGRILITTRNQNIQNTPLISSSIRVDELSLDEACELLMYLLPSGKEHTCLKEFVAKLPPFPLDISLAAYYIRDTRLSLDQYLDKLKEHQPTFHEYEQKIWREISDYPQTRYAIVGLSVEHLLKQNPQYLDLLWIIASVDSQLIPTSILSHTLPNVLDAFLHDLRKFSLIAQETAQFSHPMISLHRSTQDILKHYLQTHYGEAPSDTITSSLTLCVQHAMEEGDAFILQKLIPHVEVIEKAKHNPHLHYLLGMLYYHAGQYIQAKSLLEQEQDLDLSHPTEATIEIILKKIIYLGNTYKELGLLSKAEAMFQQALHFCQRFGHEPNKVVKLLVSLAQIHRRLGDFPKAEKLCDQSLEICHKCAANDYDSLAAIHMALCITHREQGHYKKAEEHIYESLSLYEKHLPKQHLDYANALKLLGHVCSDEGHYPQAREIYEKSLNIFLKNDQPHHPKALLIYIKLGIICRRLGETQKAHEYLDQAERSNAFSKVPAVMGLTYHERAHLYIQQALYDKAVKEARKSLDVYMQLYGEQHVKTCRALNLVGYTLMHQGTFDEAESCMLKAFQKFGEKGASLKCQALDYLSELYRRKVCLGNKDQAEELKQKSLDYIQQAIEVALQYFPNDSDHLTHLNRQKENIMRSQPGDDILSSKEYKSCQ